MGFPSPPVVLRRLSATGFRNLDDAPLELGPGANLVLGPNGQGKTNLLEAIFVLSTGRSFRGAGVRDMLGPGRRSLRLVGEVAEPAGTVTLAVEMSDEPRPSRRFLAGGKGFSAAGWLAFLPAVAVTAERMEIVRGAPDERRRFLDRSILLEDPRRAELLRDVTRLLRQKGALLSGDAPAGARRETLAGWNRALAEASARLRAARRAWAARLAAAVPDICASWGRPAAPVEIRYRPSPDGPDEADLLFDAFEKAAPAELASGRVRLGPGRDDLDITVGGQPARVQASAGEQKAIVLAMKLARIEASATLGGRPPLLLLDDLDAELDRTALAAFLARLPGGHQVVATSAKPEWIEPLLGSGGEVRRFSAVAGRIRPGAARPPGEALAALS